MYIYDHYDKTLLEERVTQFRRQTESYLAGRLSEDEFLPLRLVVFNNRLHFLAPFLQDLCANEITIARQEILGGAWVA